MKDGSDRGLFLARGFMSLALSITPVTAHPGMGQTQSATPTTQQAQDQKADEAAKAAARRKRFEEEKKRLENADPKSESATNDPQQSLCVSPVLVNMLVGESQGFSVSDAEGHNLTSQAEWSLSNSYVAELKTGGVPPITAKDHGTVRVRARIGSRSAEAEVTVHSGDTLPAGTIRWQACKTPGFTPKKIVQAVPSSPH